jgi:hypothetical protein
MATMSVQFVLRINAIVFYVVVQLEKEGFSISRDEGVFVAPGEIRLAPESFVAGGFY